MSHTANVPSWCALARKEPLGDQAVLMPAEGSGYIHMIN
mgnify:CR=1 FL=1